MSQMRVDKLADVVPPWPATNVSLSDRTYSVRRAFVDRSDHAPAVMLHGLGGSSTDWTDLMWLLRDELDSIAPDLNGFGQSPPPRDGGYSPAAHARGVAALLEHEFHGQRVHVFGNSMGGAVALQLAARRPDLVASLTLVSPAMPWIRQRRGSAALTITALPGIGATFYRKYSRRSAPVRVRATINLCFADPSSVSDIRFEQAVQASERLARLPYAQDAFLRSLRGLLLTYIDRGPDRPWVLAGRVAVPVLAVYGLHDNLVDPRSAHRVTSSFRDGRVVVLANSGHVAQLEHPDDVAAAWRSLLEPALSR